MLSSASFFLSYQEAQNTHIRVSLNSEPTLVLLVQSTPLQNLVAYHNWLVFSRVLLLWMSPANAVKSKLGMGSSGGPKGTPAWLCLPCSSWKFEHPSSSRKFEHPLSMFSLCAVDGRVDSWTSLRGSSGLQEACGKTPWCKRLSNPCCVALADVTLAKATRLAKPGVHVRGDHKMAEILADIVQWNSFPEAEEVGLTQQCGEMVSQSCPL